MRLAAAASTSLAAATNCPTKAGQVEIIKPMVAAWELHLKQAAINRDIDTQITAVEATGQTRLTTIADDISALEAEHQGVFNATVVDLVAARDAQVSNADGALTSAESKINSTHANAVIRANARHTKLSGKNVQVIADIQSANDAHAVAINAEIESENTFFDGQITALTTAYEAELATAGTAYAGSLANIQGSLDSRVASITAAGADAVNVSDGRTASAVAALEASKQPQAQTLADYENAGQGGTAVAYDNLCLVKVSTAIELVQQEYSPNDIWTAVVIDGTYSARADETPEPTDSPTVSPTVSPVTASPTVSPTTSPVTASPTVSPTRSPTKSPTRSPTKSPTFTNNITAAEAICYRNRYPDLAVAYAADNIYGLQHHYDTWGFAEGRKPTCPVYSYGLVMPNSVHVSTESDTATTPERCAQQAYEKGHPVWGMQSPYHPHTSGWNGWCWSRPYIRDMTHLSGSLNYLDAHVTGCENDNAITDFCGTPWQGSLIPWYGTVIEVGEFSMGQTWNARTDHYTGRHAYMQFQTDGNLVIVVSGYGAVWSLGSHLTMPNTRIHFQGDGNLCAYGSSGAVCTYSHLPGHPHRLILTGTGKLYADHGNGLVSVIYAGV